jgi:cytochrome c oxidase subunit 3
MSRILTFRADQERQHTAHLGMVVFLGSWAMMFGALFFGYALLRLRSGEWPPPGVARLPVLLPSINTAVMVSSSLALQMGVRSVSRDRPEALPGWLAAALSAGALFIGLQCVAWRALWSGGLRPSTGVYGGMFYLLTCFHGLHVVVGLGLLVWLFFRSRHSAFTRDAPGALPIVGLFWHFVGTAWVLIFVSVYLL